MEALRGFCVNLAHLTRNFSDGDAGEEAYFKLEDAVPPGELSALEATFCPMEKGAIIRSAQLILQFYKELAPPLARAHRIQYPADLERLMTQRLAKLTSPRSKT